MARPPRKRKPNPNYEHLTLRGSGFWFLPDLITCEDVEAGRWTNQLVIRASTYEDRRLAIPLLIPALRSLVAADPIAVQFEKPTVGRRLNPPVHGKTTEAPLLQEFVCFRGISAEWWVPEFLTEKKNQHVLVSFSFAAYKQLINHLRGLSSQG